MNRLERFLIRIRIIGPQRYLRRIPMFLIRIYQKTLSLDHGPLRFLYPNGRCRYQPTCSEYGYQAFERFGIFKGWWLTARRILRCHPWARLGSDPVPEE